MLEVNPDARSTWVNHPKPGEFPDFQRELDAIGGFHLSGKPIFRLEWSNDVRRRRLGRLRPLLVDTRIPTRRVQKSFKYQGFNLLDSKSPVAIFDHSELGNYDPKEWLVVPHVEFDVVTQSYNRWVVMMFKPPERIGETPEGWARRRYREYTPPETNQKEFGDDIGPFPSEGRYDLLLVIQSPNILPWLDYGSVYREPDRDVLDLVRGALELREQAPNQRPYEERVDADYALAEEREEQERKKIDDTVDQAWDGFHARANDGDSFNAVTERPKSNRRTRFGNAKRVVTAKGA